MLSDSDALCQFEVRDGKLSSKRLAATNSLEYRLPQAVCEWLQDGVVWVLISKGWNSFDRPAVLYAYDAANVAHELYDSEQNAGRDRAGLALRFNIPTIVNGHVYVGAKHEVDVYGLVPAAHASK